MPGWDRDIEGVKDDEGGRTNGGPRSAALGHQRCYPSSGYAGRTTRSGRSLQGGHPLARSPGNRHLAAPVVGRQRRRPTIEDLHVSLGVTR